VRHDDGDEVSESAIGIAVAIANVAMRHECSMQTAVAAAGMRLRGSYSSIFCWEGTGNMQYDARDKASS
jgi:hypothetical protein